MSDTNNSVGPGGFIPPTGGLPSPAPSTASSQGPNSLPTPRSKPLMPGGSKEALVMRYVEQQLTLISRRYVKKFSGPEAGGSVVGYKNFAEVCTDLDDLVNVLWKAGTPVLQIPFLLRLASDFTQYVRQFPPSPKATFSLLRKLDHCFASLLTGQDVVSGQTLPGFENGLRGGMTTTEMVRCRSLVQQTRVLMVEIMSSGDFDDEEDGDEEDDESGMDTDTDTRTTGPERQRWEAEEDEVERLHLDAARVYEMTIIKLNERLESVGDRFDRTDITED